MTTFDRFRLESAPLTIAYWIVTTCHAVAFSIPKLPPLVDYPQHLAIGAILRRLADPASPERALYEVNLFTYNGAFQFLVAALAFVVRPEVAGKIVLAGMVFLFAFAVLQVLRVTGRPRHYAFALLPLSCGYVVAFGFINFFIGAAIALLIFARWWSWRETGDQRGAIVVTIAALFATWAHLLSPVSAGVCALVVVLARFDRDAPKLVQFKRAAVALAPFVPAALLAIATVGYNARSPHANWEHRVWNGADYPLWMKLWQAPEFVTHDFLDGSDRWLLLPIAASLLFAWWRRGAKQTSRDLRWLALAWVLLYLVTPRVLLATWAMFERHAVFAAVFLVAATPRVEGTRAPRIVAWVLAASAALGALNVVVKLATIPDDDDASAIIDDVPSGRKLMVLDFEPEVPPLLAMPVRAHLGAFLQVRRPAEIAETFLTIESMPVHYRPARKPPLVESGFEFTPQRWDPRSPVGKLFDLVLVISTPDPRVAMFGDDGARVTILARRGRYWLIDTAFIAQLPP